MRKTIWVYFAMLLAIALGSEIPVAGPSEGKNGIWFMTKWEDSSAVARDELSRIFRDSRDVKVRRSFSRSLKMRVEKKSMRYGKTKLLEKDKIEGEIAAMTKAHASPSNGLDNLFTSNQTRFNKLSREGYVIDYATEYLKNRFKLSKTAVVSIKSKLLPKEDFCDKTGVSSLCPAYMHYRSSNGICNNLEKPFWGSTFRPFRRAAPSDYGDGFLSLRLAKDGQPLPSVRLVSSIIKDIQPKKQSSLPSVLHMAYGQFLGHDLIFAPLNKAQNGEAISCCPDAQGESPNHHPECAAIDISEDDPFYSKFEQTCMEFVRSAPAPRCKFGAREQMNEQTAYIDGSQIYGAEEEIMNSVRRMKFGIILRELTQYNETILYAMKDMEKDCNKEIQSDMDWSCFNIGDLIVNEQSLLVLFYVVWARQHNRVAYRLKLQNPSWGDEKLFQEARRIIGAQMQHVAYNEYLPLILGEELMKKFKLEPLAKKERKIFFNRRINSAISNEFATAAFPFGHTPIADDRETADDSGEILCTKTFDYLLKNPFTAYIKGATPQLTRGEVRQSAAGVDPFSTPQTTCKLSAGHLPVGLDQISINLQRGRDHGIASYTAMRSVCGYTPISDFDDLKEIMDEKVVEDLKNTYSHVDDIDLIIGGLAEHAIPGGLVGPTFGCILMDQFSRLKMGDRYWYETDDEVTRFSEDQISELRKTNLAGILCTVFPHMEEIQAQPLKSVSPENPIISCGMYPQIGIDYWRE